MARPFVRVLRKEFEAKVKRNHLVYDSCCNKCGKHKDEVKFPLELHHVVSLNSCPPERGFNPNVQENLVTLCFDCHLAYHRCFEDTYPEQKVLEWLQDVPMEEVNRFLSQFREDRAERRKREIAKHRTSGQPSG